MRITPFWESALNLLTVIVLIFFGCVLSFAAEDKTRDDFNNEFDSYVRYSASRSIKADSGKVGIIKSESEYSHELKLFEQLPVKLSLGYQYIGINDTVKLKLPAHLTGVTTDIETTLPLFSLSKTYLRLGVSPSFYGDNWDFNSSNFRIPSRYIIIYKPNEKWTFLCGVAVYPTYENPVFAIGGFIYKPNDKLVFNIVPNRPNVAYSVNERITLFTEGDLYVEEFRVSRGDPKDVVLRYAEARLGSGIKFKINDSIYSSFSAGSLFNHYLRYRDSQGKVGIKNGLYTEFRVEVQL